MKTDTQAQRVDPASGTREIARFTHETGASMFSFTHLPAGRATAGVVMCSPVHAEFIRNYRREVLMGRRLAELGIAVQRFHYRGQGNSAGEATDTTADFMREDAIAAAARLRSIAGVDRLAYFGGRFSALIAAAAASADDAPVAMWDPVLEAPNYFRDVYRARKMQMPKGVSTSSRGLQEELQIFGRAPVLGYTITRELVDSSRDLTLEDSLDDRSRQILVLRLGKDPRNDRALEELVDRWRSKGMDVDDQQLARKEAWWFSSGEATIMETAEQARTITVEWFSRVLSNRER